MVDCAILEAGWSDWPGLAGLAGLGESAPLRLRAQDPKHYERHSSFSDGLQRPWGQGWDGAPEAPPSGPDKFQDS